MLQNPAPPRLPLVRDDDEPLTPEQAADRQDRYDSERESYNDRFLDEVEFAEDAEADTLRDWESERGVER